MGEKVGQKLYEVAREMITRSGVVILRYVTRARARQVEAGARSTFLRNRSTQCYENFQYNRLSKYKSLFEAASSIFFLGVRA